MALFRRRTNKPAVGSPTGETGWAPVLVDAAIYDERWFENDFATAKVRRGGAEFHDPVPPGLRLIADEHATERMNRYLQASPPERGPAPFGIAEEYYVSKVDAMALVHGVQQSGLSANAEVKKMCLAPLKFSGISVLEGAHPVLRAEFQQLFDTVEEPRDLLAWWINLASGDPSGTLPMWIHFKMDQGCRLGLEAIGLIPERNG